jgi:hypothetical protein
MWSDDDWRNLTREAQHLYMMLLSDPKLDYCGVTSWHPGKLAQRSSETSGAAILNAGAQLANDFFVVIDEETEEVLIRSYLRHDPIMKHPRLSVTVTKDFASIGSKKIRAAIVYELQRLKRENSDWPTWDHPAVKTVLRQNAVSAKTMPTDLPVGAATYLGVGLPNGLPSATAQPGETFTRPLQQEQEQEQATGTRSIDLAARNGSIQTSRVAALQRVGFSA